MVSLGVVSVGVVSVGVIATVALAIRILRAGYGADNDTYLMLGTWDGLRRFGHYVPSRFQGSPLAEVSIGLLSWLGGHWLSGLVSALLGVVSMTMLFRLVRSRSTSGLAVALTAMVAVSPAFVIAATTSHDYIYALALFLAGWWWWERGGAPEIAGLLFALAAAARLSTIACGLVIVLCAPTPRAVAAARVRAVGVALVGTILAYLPGFLSADASLSFFGATRPTGQGIKGIAARVVLKPPLFFGWLGTVAVIIAVALVLYRRRTGDRTGDGTSQRRADHWIALVIAVQLVLWVWLPVEPSYLLPAIAAAAVYLASVVRLVTVPTLLKWAWLVVALSGWLDVAPLTILYADHGECEAVEAVDARVEPRFVAGQLLDYPATERDHAACNAQIRREQADSARD